MFFFFFFKIAKGLDRTVLTGSSGPTPVLTVHGINKKSGSLGLKNRFSSRFPVFTVRPPGQVRFWKQCLHLHVMENYTTTICSILYITYYFFYFQLHIYILSLLHTIFQFLLQVTSTQPYKIKHYTRPSATIIEH